jgi:hypothetical protein
MCKWGLKFLYDADVNFILILVQMHFKSKCVFQGNKVQSKLGLLMLLSMWLSHCPLAVKQFLSIPTSIPYLTTQVGKLLGASVLFYDSFLICDMLS